MAATNVKYPLAWHTSCSIRPPSTILRPSTMPSKLSLFTSCNNPQAMDFVRRAQPPLVKIMDAFGHEAEVKSSSPNAIIVGRAYEAQQGRLGQGDPVAEARAFFQRQLEKYQTQRGVDYWEGWNEPVPSSAEEMAWYAAFEVERVRLLAEIGGRACLGNFPVGCPSNLNWWPYFFPALRAAKQDKGLLGLHEYRWPWLDNYFGKNQINPKEDEADTGWTTGRYRKVYRNFLIPNGLAVPLVITECGIDCVNVTGQDPRYLGVTCGGWRRMAAWWSQHGGLSDPVEEYLRQLAWYDSILQADTYVIGATLFHLGVTGWGDHDLSGQMAERLTQYCAA